ncbi:DUF2141 domain-containing protein [uncultured Imperialibacter sp.]|uniref:DUF2141 domain-containing protein n=1 Tax=uncultured Imperialibacter sp. TaxID=1672639 RepID=UPI0030D9BD30|tara:strand:+ start:19782 stop:20210 length:429 start_codon:yes stop_codon:yes gene_type:complete
MIRFLPVVFLLFLFSSLKLVAQYCEITVTGLRNDNGEVRLYLFRNSDGFPEELEKSAIATTSKITNNKATVSLPASFGTYAITFMHDENLDGEMQYSWLGMPSEGFGFSNNPKVRMRAPNFEECSFVVRESGCSVTIDTKYY